MRCRVDLSYQGTHYCGWQKQPGERTVQQTIEEAFSLILREPVEITGCGRTDAGVHARNYTAHMDVMEMHDLSKIRYQVNAVLPYDIAIQSIRYVDSNFHARYEAIERHYRYYVHFYKNPFLNNQSFYFNVHDELNIIDMEAAAHSLLHYDEFLPFCKTGSDVKHFKSVVSASNWTIGKENAIYSIKANRFLRGMVRLIVGACLNVALGKLTLEEMENSLKNQTPLPLQWSVPPEGLYLEGVRYNNIETINES